MPPNQGTVVLKKENVTIDTVETLSHHSDIGFDEKQTKKLIRRIDVTLLPFLALLYLLSFLDRTNVGNARLAGLEKSLHMVGLDYNTALAVFFPFYVLAEIPSNLMMKRTRPSLWIPSIMVAWGVCCTLMGLVKNYRGLLVARAALGIAEGGLFPGIAFYITMWYKRDEQGLRTAIFFSAATAAGAFGGLLARGIVEMNGVAGLAGWQWIFILEGLRTFFVANLAFFLMHDYPVTAKFLTETERKAVARRLQQDRCSMDDTFHIKYLFAAIKDWRVYVNMLITIGIYTPLYSVSLFLPTIIKTLGYTDNAAQLMTVPPYVTACVMTLTLGYISDRVHSRGVFMICCNLLAMSGVVCLLVSTNPHIKYAGCFLFTSGIYPNVPLGIAWHSGYHPISTKRSVAIAMHVGFGNLGGILASFVFLSNDSPRFIKGNSILLGLIGMSTLLSVVMTVYCRHQNASRDRKHKAPSKYTDEERFAERDLADEASFWRYTI